MGQTSRPSGLWRETSSEPQKSRQRPGLRPQRPETHAAGKPPFHQKAWEGLEKIMSAATARRHCRPQDATVQAELYSGKKDHTVKNTLETARQTRRKGAIDSNAHFAEARAIEHLGAGFSWERRRLACSGSGQDGRAPRGFGNGHDPRLQSDRKSTRLNSSHIQKSRMPSSA